MNWYLQSGKESDVVTSTRIRFARNLPEFKFNLKDKKEIEKLKINLYLLTLLHIETTNYGRHKKVHQSYCRCHYHCYRV